jgi:hypothetical protein
MTIDVVNDKRVREIHVAPIINTAITVVRKKSFSLLLQEDELVDIVDRTEYLDNILDQLGILKPIIKVI